MFRALIGDLFASDAQTLVNTVNCVGVMGKGVAQELAQVRYLGRRQIVTLDPAQRRHVATIAECTDGQCAYEVSWRGRGER